MTRTFEYKLFADYHQFYMQDEGVEGNLGDSWTPDAVVRDLAVAPGTIGIGTVRNATVPVVVEITDGKPDHDMNGWDQVTECSIEVASGRLVVAGCTDYFPDAARIDVPPGAHTERESIPGISIHSATMASMGMTTIGWFCGVQRQGQYWF